MAIESQGTKIEMGTGSGGAETITAIALGNPTILTSAAHALANGDIVTLSNFGGDDAGDINGQLQHPQAVFKGDDSAVFLVRRRRGGNEDDAVQLQNLRELLGGPQVSEMDRVECSAKEPELHERTCPSP